MSSVFKEAYKIDLTETIQIQKKIILVAGIFSIVVYLSLKNKGYPLSSDKYLHTSFLIVVAFAFAAFSLAEPAETSCPATTPADKGGMSLSQAAILGLVEGLTEYLPVSSTGHLLLAQRVMGIGESPSVLPIEKERRKNAANAYVICIQAGAIIAVLWLYLKHVGQIVMGFLGKDRAGFRMGLNLITGFLPAAAIGLLCYDLIKTYLFGLWPIVAAWLTGGLAILAVARHQKSDRWETREGKGLADMDLKMALIIGVAQCVAMWPGMSRSLVTILGGMAVGLSMSAAVEFSFLLGVVTLGAATLFDALKHGPVMIETFSFLSLTLGFIFAFLSAIVSINWMVSYLNRHGLAIFGYYRLVLAITVALLLLTHQL